MAFCDENLRRVAPTLHWGGRVTNIAWEDEG